MTEETQNQDVETLILEAVAAYLTGDATLAALCGGEVRLWYQWADPDSLLPYLVHNLDLAAADREGIIAEGRYFLAGWDFSADAARLGRIRGRVKALLARAVLAGDLCARVTWLQDINPPVEERDVWHTQMIFAVRCIRVPEITAVVEGAD